MSDTPKRPYDLMYRQACGIVERLRPACDRIEIAGSIRRRKEMIGDIEIVLVPKHICNLFGEPTGKTEVDHLLAGWPITFVKNGEKYKQFTFAGKAGQLYTVDLFLQPDPATWGVNYLIRTGSSDFSHRMVTKKSMGGCMPNHFTVRDARVWRDGAALSTGEEMDVFGLWGMEFVPPEARV